MNGFQISGRLVREPKIEQGEGYTRVKFTLANNDVKDKPYYFDCLAYNGVADFISKNYNKGDMIIFEGKLTSYSYRTEDNRFIKGVELLVKSVVATQSLSNGMDSND